MVKPPLTQANERSAVSSLPTKGASGGGRTVVDFTASKSSTLGVEWEFALVDKVTGNLVNAAPELFAAVHAAYGTTRDSRIHREMLKNTVEVVSGIHRTVAEAMVDLSATVAEVRALANPLGIDLFGAGTHPCAQWASQQLTDSPRYDELISRTQWWGRQMMIWGVHVHVGITHRDKVLPILNALLNYYPHLLALSSSSPLWDGADTGYASTRAMMFQQLPTAGLPFQFNRWAEFEHFAHDQFTTGIIDQLNEIRWDIRPAPRLGTIEIRICDGVSNFAELSALVALTHCLVVYLDKKLTAGEELSTMAPWLVQENKWRAARYGLDAEIILDAQCNERLMVADLAELLDRLQPIAQELDCVDELAAVAEIPRRGASYQRQRRVFEETSDIRAVVKSVVNELTL